jgi:outer membrane autotransporter protein
MKIKSGNLMAWTVSAVLASWQWVQAADNPFVGPSGTSDLGNGTFTTSAVNSPAISGSGATVVINGSNAQARTTGNSSGGVKAANGAQITLDNSTISTGGTFSRGVDSSGTGTKVTLNNTNITTGAYQAYGIAASSGANVLVNGGTVNVAGGNNLSYGMYATGNGSSISGSGVTINASYMAVDAEQGGTISLKDSVITSTNTSGMPYGAYVSGSGSQLNFNNVNIITSGSNGTAVYLYFGNAVLNGGTYSTNGRESHGVMVLGGSASLSNLQINTAGAFSYGVNVNSNAYAQLNNVSISTQGATTYGIWGVGKSVTGTNVTINTTGDGAHGVCIQGGTSAFDGLNITTGGSAAYGLYSEYNVNASNLNIQTGGATGVGVAIFGGAAANLNSGTVSTTGASGYGIYGSVGTNVTANNLVVNTSGSNATGAYAYGGRLTLNGGTYSTTGAGAYGLRSLYGVISGSNLNVGSAQSAGVVLTDSSTVTLANSTVTGGTAGYLFAVGSSVPGSNSATINGGSVTAANGNAFQVNSGSTGISVNNAVVSGSNILAVSGSDAVSFTAQDSNLTGAVIGTDYDGANVVLNNGQWTITGDSWVNRINNTRLIFQNDGNYKTVTINGNLTGSAGISMNADVAAGTGDKLIISGTADGQHILLTLNGANPTGGESPLLLVSTGETVGSFIGSADKGMYQYNITSGSAFGQGANDWYIGLSGTIPNPPPPDPPSPTASTILGMVGAQSLQWFAQMDTLNKRMGELRLNHEYGANNEGGFLDNIWIRSYGSQINASSAVTGRSFNSQIYGFDLGTDKAWQLDKQNTVIGGVFAGYGVADQDFRVNGSSGESDSLYGGVYGTWLHEGGWYSDFVAKVQHFDNSFNVWDDSYNHSSGSYDNWGAGVSLEFGRQFQFKDGWFAEPQAQLSYAHLFNRGFGTQGDNAFSVANSDADLLQFRGGIAFGRTIVLNGKSSVLQPYVKISGVEQVSSGNRVSAGGDSWRPNMDGERAELGTGIAWQIGNSNQLHLEYQAAFGSKYDQPWGINAGFRHQF